MIKKLEDEILSLEKIYNKEVIKIMPIDRKTKIEYIYSTLVNLLFRYDELKLIFIALKRKGEK